MNGLLFLLYCLEILGALLCGAQSIPGPSDELTNNPYRNTTGQEDNSNTNSGPTSVASSMVANHSPSPSTATPISPRPQPTTTSTASPFSIVYRKECLPVFMVAGGLIIACTILLISTVLLTWKVCQLSRHIKLLSSNADLISTSEYWMGTAKKSKSKSETGDKETTVLMTQISQTQEDMSNGATVEEGVKVNEDGQTGEENKKEVGDTVKSEEVSTTPVTNVENASSSEPQEGATDCHSNDAEAASFCKGTDETKDVV